MGTESNLVVSNPWNDGTRNGGTTERETAERDFFSVFFFSVFFFNKKTTNKQTVNISHKIKGMHIFFVLRWVDFVPGLRVKDLRKVNW